MTSNITDTPAVPYGSAAAPALEAAGEDSRWYAAADPQRYTAPDLMLSDKLPTLVKGAGYARVAPCGPSRRSAARSRRALSSPRKS